VIIELAATTETPPPQPARPGRTLKTVLTTQWFAQASCTERLADSRQSRRPRIGVAEALSSCFGRQLDAPRMSGSARPGPSARLLEPCGDAWLRRLEPTSICNNSADLAPPFARAYLPNWGSRGASPMAYPHRLHAPAARPASTSYCRPAYHPRQVLGIDSALHAVLQRELIGLNGPRAFRAHVSRQSSISIYAPTRSSHPAAIAVITRWESFGWVRPATRVGSPLRVESGIFPRPA